MTVHHIEPERRTLHGKFSRELPPILTIDPGDTVIYRTLDAGCGGWSHRASTAPSAASSSRAIPNGMSATRCAGLDRQPALALASLVVDFRITQIVNGVRGVHAVLPHGAITRHP